MNEEAALDGISNLLHSRRPASKIEIGSKQVQREEKNVWSGMLQHR